MGRFRTDTWDSDNFLEFSEKTISMSVDIIGKYSHKAPPGLNLSHCVSGGEALQERIPLVKPDAHCDPIGNYGTLWIQAEFEYTPSMNQEDKSMAGLKAAVIGCGAIAQNCHLLGYQKSKACDLIAAVDPCEARRKEAEKIFGVPRTYSTAEALFENEQPDVVSICTPNRFHAAQAILALEHGCHVLCEKPLCLTLADARRIQKARDKAGTIFMTAFTHRLFRGNITAKKILDKGEIGKPFMIRVRFAHEGPQPGWAMSDWFYNPDLAGGGAMLDMGIHAIDLAHYYIGPITSISATIKTLVKKIRVEDNAVLLLEFEQNCLGYIEVGWTSKPGFAGVEIYGTEGTIIFDYLKGLSVLRGKTSPDGTVKTSWRVADKHPTQGGWEVEIDYFLRHVRKGIQPEASLEAGIQGLAVALAAYHSAQTGKRVKI